MAARRISDALSDYTLARQQFAQECAKSTESKAGAKVLVATGGLPLLVDIMSSAPSWQASLRPVEDDDEEAWIREASCVHNVPSLESTREETARLAALALAHLAAYHLTAKQVAKPSVLSALVHATKTHVIGDRALDALTFLSSHSTELARRCVSAGCLSHAFQEHGPRVQHAQRASTVKQAQARLPALRLAAELARHGSDPARAVLDAPGCLQEMCRCVQGRMGASWTTATRALGLVALQDESLARRVAESGALHSIADRLSVPNDKLEAITALWSVAMHSADLAELVATLDDDVVANVLTALIDCNEAVRHAAALLVRDLAKRTMQLSQLAVDAGAGGALTQLLQDTSGRCRLHAAVALGYMAAQSPVFALAIIAAKAVEGLVVVVREDPDHAVLEAASWTLGQLGRHSAKHVEEMADQHVLTTLAEAMSRPRCSDAVSAKVLAALEQIIPRCKNSEALQPLLHQSHPRILGLVVHQLAKILPNDPRGRRLMVCTGGLRRLQEVPAEPGSVIAENVAVINCCFPEEVIRYYSPGFPDALLELIEDFDPPSEVTSKQGTAVPVLGPKEGETSPSSTAASEACVGSSTSRTTCSGLSTASRRRSRTRKPRCLRAERNRSRTFSQTRLQGQQFGEEGKGVGGGGEADSNPSPVAEERTGTPNT